MKIRYGLLACSLVLSLLISCMTRGNTKILSTPTLYIITSTLVPTITPQPTDSPKPPSPIPTISPAPGITTTQVNVRSLPLVNADLLGQLGIFTKVEITGMSSDGDWYQINYSIESSTMTSPPNHTGIGWVNSDYIQVEGDVVIPVTTSKPLTTSVTPDLTDIQITDTPALNYASPLQPFSSIANEDGDSVQNPAINIEFSPTGVRSITYASDVSSPQGDLVDWLRFKPYSQPPEPSAVSVVINCSGGDEVNIQLLQVSQVLQTWEHTSCKSASRLLLSLFSTAPYLLRISPAINDTGLNFVSYAITIEQGY